MMQVARLSPLLIVKPLFRHPSVCDSRFFFAGAFQSVYSSCFAPGCLPVDSISHSLNWIHTNFHLPWWGSVVVTTLLLRTAVVTPFTVYSTINSYKLRKYLASERFKQCEEEMKNKAMLQGLEQSWSEKKYQITVGFNKLALNREAAKKYPSHIGQFLFIQFPLWISTSFALRNMCGYRGLLEPENPVSGFSSGGIGSFRNLLEADPVLAFLILSLNVANIQLVRLQALNSKLFRFIQWVSLVGSLYIFALSFYAPSVLPLYWSVSAGHQLVNRLILMSPRVLRTLGVEPPSKTPYRDLLKPSRPR